MKITRIIKRGIKNSRVELEDGTTMLVPTTQLTVGGESEAQSSVPATAPPVQVPVNPHEAVQARFEQLEKMVNLVAKGHSPSLLVCGDAGIGKTYTVRHQLGRSGLKELSVSADEPETSNGKGPGSHRNKQKGMAPRAAANEFLFVKGYSSPMGLYSVLHNNREALIVFDDCDAIFKAEVSVNILKSALDSYDKRIVSWFSPKCAQLGYDQQFEFKGRVIFISNLPFDRIHDAVKSRSFMLNMQLSRPEVWARMYTVIDAIEPRAPSDLKMEVLNFMGTEITRFPQFDMRTLVKGIRIRQSGDPDWKKLIFNFA